MTDKINTNLNYFLYTVNFHPTDMSSFEEYLKWLKVKIKDVSIQYWLNTEYDNDVEKHFHCVISVEKCKANETDKMKKKLLPLSQKKYLNQIINTNEDAFNIKLLHDIMDIYSGIGYIIKQGKDNLYTNEGESQLLEQCYKSYIYKSKKPIAPLPHVEPYKLLSVGNVRDYCIHHAKENPDIPIQCIPDYLVQHQKVSFLKISKYQKEQVIRETRLVLSDCKDYYNYITEYEDKVDMENEVIKIQKEKIDELELEKVKMKAEIELLKLQLKQK